ncbi:MAG: class I SAM-dependent methyltransferase [Planctomycetota bacterium]|jgi:ubiquinone/menaquinone biosynthesis C-methylase UbiE
MARGKHRKRGGTSDSPNVKYHDRVAGIYDNIYDTKAYWRFWRDVVWKRARAVFPEPPADLLEAGGGTGHFGLRAARAGYRTVISDLSVKMCERARKNALELPESRRPEVVEADLQDLQPFDDASFDALMAIGDVLSFVPDARKALRAAHRVVRPGGAIVATVDSTYAAIEHILTEGGPPALERFLKDGKTEFLTKKQEERFPTKAFTPERLRTLCEQTGWEEVAVYAQLALPVRKHRELLEDTETYQRLLKLEMKLGAREPLLATGGCLLFTARRADQGT